MKSDESDELTCFVYTVCRIFPIELSQPNSLIRGVQMYKKKECHPFTFHSEHIGFQKGKHNILKLNNILRDFLEKSHESFETYKSLVSSETFETCQR